MIEDVHYPKDPDQVVFVPKAVEGLRLMQQKGYLLFVVSNQSGVGRGLISDRQFESVHDKFCQLLKAAQVQIETFAYCFHHPDDKCLCRKPGTALISPSHQNTPISFAHSYTVGDKLSDLELASHLGAKGCLVLSGKGQGTWEQLVRLGRQGEYSVYPDLLALAERLPYLIK
jgi:D-glycero-D-manno-heptose 1,7-bisphosphate phosphatase